MKTIDVEKVFEIGNRIKDLSYCLSHLRLIMGKPLTKKTMRHIEEAQKKLSRFKMEAQEIVMMKFGHDRRIRENLPRIFYENRLRIRPDGSIYEFHEELCCFQKKKISKEDDDMDLF